MSLHPEDLTEEQRKTIEDAEAALGRLVADVQARLAESGVDIPPGQPGDFSCTFCDCASFESGTDTPPTWECASLECGHSFIVHRVF